MTKNGGATVAWYVGLALFGFLFLLRRPHALLSHGSEMKFPLNFFFALVQLTVLLMILLYAAVLNWAFKGVKVCFLFIPLKLFNYVFHVFENLSLISIFFSSATITPGINNPYRPILLLLLNTYFVRRAFQYSLYLYSYNFS